MQFTARTIALEGVEARPVDVQCQLSRGPHSFQIVGLPGAAVREARERVMAAFYSHSLSLPPKRITLNLSPADLPKAGAHYDLPIAISLLVAMEVLPRRELEGAFSLGELALDGRIDAVGGVLAAALTASEEDHFLICSRKNAAEAMLLPDLKVLAPEKLVNLVNHFRGRPINMSPHGKCELTTTKHRDISEIKGLRRQKRALEIAATGRHHLFMVGSPGAGKSMLASSLPSIMPPMLPIEILETTLVHSAAGLLKNGCAIHERPYFDPHHSASAASIVGGGRDAKPGEISLAHNGVLFMDEFPEFKRDVLESLRQPLETAEILVSRVNAHYKYPAKFLLVAAANPCQCGWMYNSDRWCNRAPECGQRYMERLSGPLIDRFSLRMGVQELSADELRMAPSGETSEQVRARVTQARKRQYLRNGEGICNEDLNAPALDNELGRAQGQAAELAQLAMDNLSLSTRGYYRLIKTARTIADLAEKERIQEEHISEAALYRILEQDEASFDPRKTIRRIHSQSMKSARAAKDKQKQ